MTPIRWFFLAETLVWLPYGIYLLLAPGALGEIAAISAASPTGTTELRAMYGGLQAALGVLCATALGLEGMRNPALTTLLFLATGLATARLYGLSADGGLSVYTGFAIVFEILTATGAAWFKLRR